MKREVRTCLGLYFRYRKETLTSTYNPPPRGSGRSAEFIRAPRACFWLLLQRCKSSHPPAKQINPTVTIPFLLTLSPPHGGNTDGKYFFIPYSPTYPSPQNIRSRTGTDHDRVGKAQIHQSSQQTAPSAAHARIAINLPTVPPYASRFGVSPFPRSASLHPGSVGIPTLISQIRNPERS